MAYIQVEASVRTHRKFLEAGPAASWLWLCGMGYCQDGLTDGFIPFQAIDFLGVKGTTARKLKCVLVSVGLWEDAPGGWQVHDYLTHNKSQDAINITKGKRSRGGHSGGRPRKETLPVTSEVSRKVSHDGNLSENPSHLISTNSSHLISDTPAKVADSPPFNRWLLQLQAAYPPNRVTRGFMTENSFFEQVNAGPEPPADRFAVMLANLENQKAGHEWRVKGMVPKLEKWLRDGLWLNVHPADAPVAEQLGARVNRTLSAAANILKEGA